MNQTAQHFLSLCTRLAGGDARAKLTLLKQKLSHSVKITHIYKREELPDWGVWAGRAAATASVAGTRVRGRLDLSAGKGEFLRIYKKDLVMVPASL